ncbi:MAG: hypothetical protein Kow0090_11870 [Myxococcota bacterium]
MKERRKNKSEEISPRERILNAASRLFARKGYSGTGIREIAKEAGVNIAMINYYFGSKPKLLEAIVEEFFENYGGLMGNLFEKDIPPNEMFRLGVKNIFAYFKENPERAIVAISTLPIELPELADLRARRIQTIIGERASRIFPKLAQIANESFTPEFFPMLVIGSLLFHFQMRNVISKVFPVSFNENYYERFAERLADILLYGIMGKSG